MKIEEHVRAVFTAPVLSPTGDLVRGSAGVCLVFSLFIVLLLDALLIIHIIICIITIIITITFLLLLIIIDLVRGSAGVLGFGVWGLGFGVWGLVFGV